MNTISNSQKKDKDITLEEDSEKYPEAYRKKSGHVKGSNKSTNPPFDIGLIQEIWSSMDEKRVRLRIRCLFRPYQVKFISQSKSFSKDLNLVYLTDVEKNIDVEAIEGKCWV